ncbi:MAG: radical SAM protein [Clostridia bacterium]|nr:radical SAM protein [Clostridia bacterium]
MRIIRPGNKDLGKLLPAPEMKDVRYVPADFMLRGECAGGTLLCHTMTGELALLTPEESRLLDGLPGRADPALADLVAHRFAVPEGSREEQTVEQLRALLLRKRRVGGAIVRYNILPTTHCNARCFYCYESGLNHVHMSAETADRLAAFIADHAKGRPVMLSWFGGEPTLGRERIDRICARLNELQVPYESTMVSNGYLFDEELVRQAVQTWKLRHIQITLDGTEEIYNRTKAYAGVTGSPYQRVLRNIALLREAGVYVDVRLNLDKHNGDDLACLIRELGERFRGADHLTVYVSRLKEDVGFEPIPHFAEDSKELDDRLVSLQRLLESMGWRQFRSTELPSLRVSSCMADDPAVIQCTPEGILSKCEDGIYDRTIGTLEDGITNRENERWWQERTAWDGCTGCPLYPACVYLLSHCPVKHAKCLPADRERRIARYTEVMLERYEAWKRGGEQEGTGQA